MTMTQRRRRLDDDDADDDGNGPYDPRYPGKRVVADGGRVRAVYLTDGRPDRPPPTKQALFDRNYQPHFADLSDASLQDGLRAAEDAYEARSRWLADAWRTMPSGTGGAAKTTAPPGDDPGDDDETMTPRDRYIKRLQTAYRTPPGQPDRDDDADAIERQRQAWAKAGAKPGPRQTSDAAGDRVHAYRGYLERISEGWRRP